MKFELHLQKHIYIYLILSMICWGVSWPTSKILTRYTDIYTITFLKFLLSGLTLIPLLIYIFKPKIYWFTNLYKILLGAIVFNIFYNFFMFYGLKIGYAGLGGVIVTGSNPIFTFLIVAFLEKTSIPSKQKFALILGLIGTIITIHIFSIDIQNIFDGGNILFLLASLSWSLVTIFSTKAKQMIHPILFTSYLYLSSSLFTLAFFTSIDTALLIFHYDYIFWISLIFTTVITTGLATTFYFYASNILGANYSASFIFITPLFAVLASSLFLNETPTLSTILGGVLLVLAIYLINKK